MEQSKFRSALFRAAEKGDTTTVRELLRKGANVNARFGRLGKGYGRLFDPPWMNPLDMDEWTPLMAAINRGFADIVQILLENGADIEASESNGLTALCQDRELLQTAFEYALSSKGCPGLQDADRVQSLLDLGADCHN